PLPRPLPRPTLVVPFAGRGAWLPDPPARSRHDRHPEGDVGPVALPPDGEDEPVAGRRGGDPARGARLGDLAGRVVVAGRQDRPPQPLPAPEEHDGGQRELTPVLDREVTPGVDGPER